MEKESAIPKHNELARPLYPTELVTRYGAKAGILLYVAEYLPDIPQMPMIVTEQSENITDFLIRADKEKIGWPRLFRSSAVEELDGYEGEFLSIPMQGFDYWKRWKTYDQFSTEAYKTVEQVMTYPRALKSMGGHAELPDTINVIATEISPSRYFGTYIQHPNKADNYLLSLTDSETRGNYKRTTFEVDRGRVSKLVNYSSSDHADNDGRDGIEEVISWHDRIAFLPDMDASWSYQIEFGIEPAQLYQVRPFKRRQNADFTLDQELDPEYDPLVIGITTADGVVVKVEHNPSMRRDRSKVELKRESLVYDDLRSARYNARILKNPLVTIYTSSGGLLQHDDIHGIRNSQVNALYAHRPWNITLEQGEWVRVVSDGTRIEFEKVDAYEPE